jgi:hypothetical protein
METNKDLIEIRANWSVSQSASQPVSQSASQPASQSVSQSVNQPTFQNTAEIFIFNIDLDYPFTPLTLLHS